MLPNPPKNNTGAIAPATRAGAKNPFHGWVVIDKPLGLTSNDVVMQVKRLLRPTKIGHAGTLDPLASGMLPLALGEGTKCVPLMMDAKKTYQFTITFGEQRSTDDAEGEVVARSDMRPTFSDIEAILPAFTGEITQVPPIYSALKVDGKRAYDLARAGEAVELKPRCVTIFNLTLLSCHSREGGNPDTEIPAFAGMANLWQATFQAIVSKGTYIRSLGRDMAQALGTVGYISALRRTAIGGFSEAAMISLDFLHETVHSSAQALGETLWLRPLTHALDGIPATEVDGAMWQNLRHGRQIALSLSMPPCNPMVITHRQQLVAIGEWDGTCFKPSRFLHTIDT